MTHQDIPQKLPPDDIDLLIADCEFIAAACRENPSPVAKEIVELAREAKEILQRQAEYRNNSIFIPEEKP